VTEPASSRHHFVVADGDAGLRLDTYLARVLPDISRARAQALIRSTSVQVSGRPAKPSLPLMAGLTIDVEIPAPVPARPEPEALPLQVIHDDEDIVVVDKPAGMVVHPGAGHRGGTLVNALLHHVRGLSGIGGTERPGIVHRLDRGTSGVMVVAKHDRAHQQLSAQFRRREVDKQYLALVWGRPPASLEMSGLIGRDPRNRQRMSGRAQRGRAAWTAVMQVEPLDGVSLLRVRIGTGRTHQIRVHLSEAGYPIVGDALYGGVRKGLPPSLAPLGRLDRPFLHAARLAFRHPGSGQPVVFEAPVPTDLETVLSALRRTTAARDSNPPEGADD
jgi:23S rRNA pseudouridine1911/1915/1917 synthase